MTAGFSGEEPDPAEAFYYGLHPEEVGLMEQLRIAFSQSIFGSNRCLLKQKLTLKP